MTPVGVIADMVCQERGDNTAAQKFWAMQLLALGFQKMHLFLNNQDIQIETVGMCMEGGSSFELPKNFIYETKVGIRRKGLPGDYFIPGTPPGPLCTLTLNNKMNKQGGANDTEAFNQFSDILNGNVSGECDCYFYNSSEGTIGSYGRGYYSGSYYSIQNGQIHVSPNLYNLGDDLELVVEYKSDGLSDGLKLVPSEAFLALRYWCKAEMAGEGPNGENRRMWENEWGTLKRLYNRRPIDVMVELFANN